MKPQENSIDTEDYKELYEHPWNDNYEITKIIPKENKVSYFQMDIIAKNIFVNSFYEPAGGEKEEIIYNKLHIDHFGNILNSTENFTPLPDGTMKGFDFYSNWIINGDTTRHRYINPFTGKK